MNNDDYIIAHVEDEEVVRRSTARWLRDISKKRLMNPKSNPSDTLAGQKMRNSELREALKGFHAALRGVEATQGRERALMSLENGYRGFATAARFRADLEDRAAKKVALPQLIMLDLKLDDEDDDNHDDDDEISIATSLIEYVRKHANPGINCIPIVILSNSDSSEEINLTISLGANAYAVKGNMEELRFNILAIVSFWIGANKSVA